VRHDGGDVVRVGDVEIELVHTPGHTPGSQCYLVRERLVAGDTLFVSGCGRVDLPGGDPGQMQQSLRTLAKLDDRVILHPGHNYGATPTSTMAEQRRSNFAIVGALAGRD
jgi:glyoxylase-like metal-dependent hydrolase (beta-lactamase superfamily II)